MFAQRLKSSKFTNPRAVAQCVLDHLPTNTLIGKAEVAGAGFINIYLQTSVVEVAVQSLFTEGVAPPNVPPEKVVVDYSSPNIAKDMHVGHLRSTILGDVVSRVLEFCGHEVVRVNHVGDWGTQFGMLIAYLKEKYPDCCENPPNIQDLGKFYAVRACGGGGGYIQ